MRELEEKEKNKNSGKRAKRKREIWARIERRRGKFEKTKGGRKENRIWRGKESKTRGRV